MFHYYKIFLILGMFLLAFAAIGWRNKFDRAWKTAMRFVLAVGVVWAYLLMSRFIVDEMDLALATSQEARDAVYDGDGAKNVAALMFGWIPGIMVASFTWALARGWHWLRVRLVRADPDQA